MEKLKWHTEQRKVNDLVPFEGNPRKMTKEQAEQLQKSLEKFNLAEIPAIDVDNKIIAGHQRIKILQALGRGNEIIDVRVPNRKLTDKEFREYNLRSNKNTGDWDFDELANYDEELLLDVGFDKGELDTIFDANDDEEFDVEKKFEELLKNKERRVISGDIWILGEHKLIIGDSTDFNTWNKLLGKERFDLMFTDPPYLGVKNFGCNQYKYLSVKKNVEPKDYDSWLSLANKFQNENGANVLIFEGWRNLKKLWNSVEKYWKVKNLIVWRALKRYQYYVAKKSFPSRYDPILLAGKNKGLNEDYEKELEEYLSENNQVLLDYCNYMIYGQNGESYWDRAKKTKWAKIGDYIECEIDNSKTSVKEIKGTKPISLLLPYIKILSPREGIVAEPFCGSGSTLIGCEIMHRKCRAIEIEPLYGELILMRWEQYTGKKAVKING